MVRSPGFRTLAALTSLAAGFALPGNALAHGLAHLRAEHEHAEDESAAHAEVHAQGATVTAESVTVTPTPAEDHAHPRVELAPTVRADVWTPAVVVRVEIVFDEVAGPEVIELTDARLPGPAPPGKAPPRLRAPPTS